MKIAYLTNQYPKVSHSFIRREIAALEADGDEVLRYSVRRTAEPLVDESDKQEQKRTRVILSAGFFALWWALVCVKCRYFGRFLKAWTATWQMARRSHRGLMRHTIYLVEACWLAKSLLSEHVTHLHAHFGTNSATVARLTHLLTGIPYSFTVHGPEEFDRPDELDMASKIKDAAFVIAISQYGRSQLYRWCDSAHWPKLHVVHCGLDRDFLEQNVEPVPDHRQFVCVGRLCEQKGQLLLLEAARCLMNQGKVFELVLVGDGPMRAQLESRILRNGLSKCVRITGWQSGEQVRRWIEQSRAMVLPSFAEGLPVVIMESLAMGRPVISTYVAGIPELVTDDCGWLVPAGSVDALTSAMRKALDASHAQLEQMGKAGARRVRQAHDIRTTAAALHRLFTAHDTDHVEQSSLAVDCSMG